MTQPISFLQLVWAALLGMVAFGEALDPYVFAGGGIIVAAATYISHREVLAARRLQTPARRRHQDLRRRTAMQSRI